jgi:DNA-binding MarR family transcriptional regulator
MEDKRRVMIDKSKTMRTAYASIDEVRAAWALVSRQPTISIRSMAAEMKTTVTRTHYMLKFLERAGYIKHKRGMTGREVIIPLYETRTTV